ncbi:MAG TPA: uroporphyrinogen-III C-methyltransferase [Acidimicrobiales bacterium]|nr:uroporphyrinogen-III C-methyltransferase [Acidimicrobiales bacterium]
MTVHLVGAGPGDPGLLTRRGAELLARADVILYDRLVDPALLALARPGCELVDVGKRPSGGGAGGNGGRQKEINDLLVARGRAGGTVVRLKGGDPFLFGRGGEEAEALRAAGVPYEVVPGVSSATAVPAAAGIPVTHRGLSSSVTVVTGHVGDPTAPGGVDWASFARAGGTLVVLMGMATRADIARQLLEGGRAPGTPVAVVEWGTTGRQRTVRTRLDRLADVEAGSPAVIVVGEVAALELVGIGEGNGGLPAGAGPGILAGEPGVLAGRTVVVTRPKAQAAELVSELGASGARVVELPLIEVAAPEEGDAALAAAAGRCASYDWVVFTSANAVHRFVPLLRDARSFGAARLAVVGPATGAALAEYHLVADLVASPSTAEGLVASLPAARGGRVLFPRALDAAPTLAAGLRHKGWVVDDVVAYRTVRAPAPAPEVARAVRSADAVTFASPSAVAAYRDGTDAAGAPLGTPEVAACIGPATAAAARRAGFPTVLEAERASAQGLVAALGAHFALGA